MSKFSIHHYLDNIVLSNGSKIGAIPELKGATVEVKLDTIKANYDTRIKELKYKVAEQKTKLADNANSKKPSSKPTREVSTLKLEISDLRKQFDKLRTSKQEIDNKYTELSDKYDTEINGALSLISVYKKDVIELTKEADSFKDNITGLTKSIKAYRLVAIVAISAFTILGIVSAYFLW